MALSRFKRFIVLFLYRQEDRQFKYLNMFPLPVTTWVSNLDSAVSQPAKKEVSVLTVASPGEQRAVTHKYWAGRLRDGQSFLSWLEAEKQSKAPLAVVAHWFKSGAS